VILSAICAVLMFLAEQPGDRPHRGVIVVHKFETASIVSLLRANGHHGSAEILEQQYKRQEMEWPGKQTHWWHEESYRYFRRLLKMEP
jgi:hypothetical protein